MKVVAVECRRADLKISEPYTIAYESYDTAPNFFLRLDTDAGMSGYGCAAPDAHVTDETPEDVGKAFEGPVTDALLGADPLCRMRLLSPLREQIGQLPATLAAVDMALLDLLGRAAGLPVYKLLGGFRDCMETSVTIGILSERETVEKAVTLAAAGFRALKLKGGRHVDEDVARVIKVREAVGPAIALRFDANQGYTLEEASRFLERASSANLEIFEQPTPGGSPALMGSLHGGDTAVMADESLLTRADALYLAGEEMVDLINVKIMKVGGIDEALRITAVGAAAGVGTMVGCMDEAALGIAAGLHYALARPGVAYADLDGHLDLVDDPSAGCVILRDGVLYPADDAGFGCALRWP